MQRRGRECGRPRWRSGGGKKQGGPNEVGSLVRTPVHPSTVQHDQKSASKGVRNATRCDGRTTDAPAHRPTILREDGGVMPTEHRPERREAGGGRECDGGAIMAPHFPTNSSGAYLFRWHGGGGAAARRWPGGQREQRGRPGCYRRERRRGDEALLFLRPTLNFGRREEEEAEREARGGRGAIEYSVLPAAGAATRRGGACHTHGAARRRRQLYDPSTQLEWRTE